MFPPIIQIQPVMHYLERKDLLNLTLTHKEWALHEFAKQYISDHYRFRIDDLFKPLQCYTAKHIEIDANILFGADTHSKEIFIFKSVVSITINFSENPNLENSNKALGLLPKNLKSLALLGKFNQPVEHLPLPLTHLKFGNDFKHSVDKLPPALTHLTFGDCFKHPVDNLPPALTHLALGYEFDQPIDNLPPKLTHLTLSGYFNQKVDTLPQTLTHLTFGDYFKHWSLD